MMQLVKTNYKWGVLRRKDWYTFVYDNPMNVGHYHYCCVKIIYEMRNNLLEKKDMLDAIVSAFKEVHGVQTKI